MVVAALPHKRLRPPVQIGDPFIHAWARNAVAGFDLSILPNADTDQPSGATHPETFELPSALHHPWKRRKGGHEGDSSEGI
jgi:hypothetical protein